MTVNYAHLQPDQRVEAVARLVEPVELTVSPSGELHLHYATATERTRKSALQPNSRWAFSEETNPVSSAML